nr:polysaccharide deacetylase family protein [uncultured Blautia sp.]
MLSYVSLFFRRLKNSFILRFLLLMVTAFILGSTLGIFTGQIPRSQKTSAAAQSTGWGLSFQEEGKRPAGNASIDDLKQYNAYYAGDTDQKIIYLTFDAGYENGNTPAILDALKKHQAPAVFFVVGNFIKDNPDLIRRILADDHIIGNHTMTHPDLPQISSMDAFQKELQDVEELYTSLTGEAMTKFYRPPRGIYSTENLSMAKELGYSTFFWSLAYVDWIQDQQPSREEAFQKLLTRIHPGAIVLLHNTSSTNAEILDELLTKWEEMGYEFHSLKELTGV